MLLARFVHTSLSLFLPKGISYDIIALILGGVSAFLVAYLLTFGVIRFCKRVGWLDQPADRRVHTKAVPRLGGVAMFLAFVVASLCFYIPSGGKRQLIFGAFHSSESVIYLLFLAAATVIVLVHAYDDVKGLKPWPKLLAQTVAVIIILGPGWTMFHGVLLYTFSNPFYRILSPWFGEANLRLFLDRPAITFAAIPAVLLTWFWIVGMMNTVNLIDGLDGLATGVVAITALFITIISWSLHQYSIAILAGIFTGAVLGFLPHNWNPAKIFMGDSGSQFLGLGLAILSIMGGAKVALALMVLGIPILDVAVVMINRVRRGQHPLHYDTTHLHYRLRATGLSVKQICYLFYSFTILFGVLALILTRIYKLLGIGIVGIAMTALIIWIDYRQRQRGTPIKLGGPETGPTPGSGAPELDASRQKEQRVPSGRKEVSETDEASSLVPDAPAEFSQTQLLL